MRWSTFWILAAAIVNVSHSFRFFGDQSAQNHSLHEKRQTLSTSIVFSSPADDGPTTGFPGYSYTQQTFTFTAITNTVVLTILCRNDPYYYYYDDFSVIQQGTSVNIVGNPGFETGSDSPWYSVGHAVGDIEQYMPHTGLYAFVDGIVGGIDGLAQSLTTVPGSLYTLTFWVSSPYNTNAGYSARTQVTLTNILESPLPPPTLTSANPTNTDISQPVINGQSGPLQLISLYLGGILVGTTISSSTGSISIQVTAGLTVGTNIFTATAAVGDQLSLKSVPYVITYSPTPSLTLSPTSDSGFQGDGFTIHTSLILVGQGDISTVISFYDGATVIGSTSTDSQGAYSYTSPNLALGPHTLTASESPDIRGNIRVSAPLLVTIVAPPETPTLTIQSVDTDPEQLGDDSSTDTTVVLGGVGTPGNTIQVFDSSQGSLPVGTTIIGPTGAFRVILPGLRPGAHSFTATATDAFGDSSPPSSPPVTFTIFPLPPVIAGFSPDTDTGGPGSYVTYDNPVEIVGTAFPNSQVILSGGLGEGRSNGNGDFTVTTVPLAITNYDITATVVLSDGTTSDPSNAFLFSVVSPPITVITGFTAQPITIDLTGEATTDEIPVIDGTALLNANIILVANGVTIGSGTSDSNGNFAVTTYNLTPGDYSIQAQASTRRFVSDFSAPFLLTILPPPSLVESIGTCVLLGCFPDPVPGSVLTGDIGVNPNDMSVEICAAYCYSYTYFGVENSGECYCGNTIALGTTLSPPSNCQSQCNGNPTEFCGGSGSLDCTLIQPKSED
jgi:hypothetical protein